MLANSARNLPDGVRNWVLFAARCYVCAALAVMRCLCVCPSHTFVDSVKTNNRIVKLVSPSDSHTKPRGNIPTGTTPPPPNSGVECRCDRLEISILSQYLSSLRAVNRFSD